MIKFSANLGFLWTDLPLIEAIYKAKKHGFDAVELQWPYDVNPIEVKNVLEEINLPVLGINTLKGNVEKGDFGLAAVKGRETEAREYISQAIEYAEVAGIKNVHVMAGKADLSAKSLTTFLDNLKFAKNMSAPKGIKIIIEPLNRRDVPGYFLTEVEQAKEICELIDEHFVKIMFDCYHVQINQGDILKRFQDNISSIGHVQIASLPDRGEPDFGELNFKLLLAEFYKSGYDGYIGGEYRPRKTTEDGLGWLKTLK